LRERQGDVEILARYFVDRFARDLKKRVMLSAEAIDELRRYDWPGNVRELQNCIERAVILADGDTIRPRHLNLSFREAIAPAAAAPPDAIDLSGTLADATRRVVAEVERRKILLALEEAGGQKPRAADLLQVSYKTLLQKIKDYGLER